jgi:hypothetical protein
MKNLRIRRQQFVIDPLQKERLLRAIKIILEHQEAKNASQLLRDHHLAWFVKGIDKAAQTAAEMTDQPSKIGENLPNTSKGWSGKPRIWRRCDSGGI